MSGCGDEYLDLDGDVHVCGRPDGHRGAHGCEVYDHWVESCGDGCCTEHPETGRTWTNTPFAMALGAWTIETAEPGDILLLDRSHDVHRAVEVIWNGGSLIVVRQKGAEVAYRHSDWAWYILDRPSLRDAA